MSRLVEQTQCFCSNYSSDYLPQVFDKEGQFIRSIDLSKAGTALKKPLAVAVDLQGNVAVCDTGNHRVWLLQIQLHVAMEILAVAKEIVVGCSA